MPQKSIRLAIDMSVIAVNPLTGVGVYSLNLFKAFLKREPAFEVRLFASSARPVREHLDQLVPGCSCARIVRWPTRLKSRLWTSVDWPPIEWFTGNVDAAYGGFHLLPATRRALRTVMVFDVAWMHFPHVNTPQHNAQSTRFITHAVRHADAVFAISENTKQDLINLFKAAPEKVHVICGGINLDEFARPLDEEALATSKQRHGIPGPYFIYIGNLEPRKNLPRTLEAYARVRNRFKDAPTFVLVGRPAWMFEPVFDAAARLSLEDHVVFTGFIPHSEKMTLLRGACACVYPSLYEGFGLPVLEAMAAGVPVLTSNVSSLPEVIGDTGLTVDPESVEAIETGMIELLEHQEAAVMRAKAAFERAKGFTWDHSAAALAAAFRRLVP